MQRSERSGFIIIFVFAAAAIFTFSGLPTLVHRMTYQGKQKKRSNASAPSKTEFEEQLLIARIEVQENNYRQITQELHDNVGQLLSTAKILIGMTEMHLSPVPETLVTASETLGRAIRELRQVSRTLQKERLQQFDLMEYLTDEVKRINDRGYIRASLECATEIPLRPGEQLLLYRVLQQAILHAMQNTGLSQLRLHIFQKMNLVIRVMNDGRMPSLGSRMGATSMRHRVELLGGTIRWHSSSHTTVTITIPLLPPDAT